MSSRSKLFFRFALCASSAVFLISCGGLPDSNRGYSDTGADSEGHTGVSSDILPNKGIRSLAGDPAPVSEASVFEDSADSNSARIKGEGFEPSSLSEKDQEPSQDLSPELQALESAFFESVKEGRPERLDYLRSVLKEKGIWSGPEDGISNEFAAVIMEQALAAEALAEDRAAIKKAAGREEIISVLERAQKTFLEKFKKHVQSLSLSDDYILDLAMKSSANVVGEQIVALENPHSGVMKGHKANIWSGREIYRVHSKRDSSGGSILTIAPMLEEKRLSQEYKYKGSPVYERERAEKLPYLQEVIGQLEGFKARAIGVNMYKSGNVLGIINLAKYVKERGLDVYVLGSCNLTCSNYLLPAAKSVHIGRYGVILHGGGEHSLMEDDIRRALDKGSNEQRKNVYNHIRHNGEESSWFFQQVDPAGDYYDLLKLSSHLIGYKPWLVELFRGNLKRKGSTFAEWPEKSKFSLVLPSAEILKEAGINISYGENHLDKLPSGELEWLKYRNKILELDSKDDIDRCFNGEAPLNKLSGGGSVLECVAGQ